MHDCCNNVIIYNILNHNQDKCWLDKEERYETLSFSNVYFGWMQRAFGASVIYFFARVHSRMGPQYLVVTPIFVGSNLWVQSDTSPGAAGSKKEER